MADPIPRLVIQMIEGRGAIRAMRLSALELWHWTVAAFSNLDVKPVPLLPTAMARIQ